MACEALVVFCGSTGQANDVPASCNVFHFIIQPPSLPSSVDQECAVSQAHRDIITFEHARSKERERERERAAKREMKA